MSINQGDTFADAGHGVTGLLARAAAAGSGASARLDATIDDLFLSADARLDDRSRDAVNEKLAALVGGIAADLRSYVTRTLPDIPTRAVLPRLKQAGLLRDPELLGELIGQARLEQIGAALRPDDGNDAPSLLVRLAQREDRFVATAANSLMLAESRGSSTPVPAETYHRLLWRVAAALREAIEGSADGPALEHAIGDAAARCLSAYDEGLRVEAAATRLAIALEATRDELPALLVEALGDRQPGLFVALLAHAARIEFTQARDYVVDVRSERLWLTLRAIDAPRDAIARIGFLLAEADGRRDLEVLADGLDTIMAISADQARTAQTPENLPPEYVAARTQLARTPR